MKTVTLRRFLFSCKTALRAIGLVFFAVSYYFGIQTSTRLILGTGRDGEEEQGTFILPEHIIVEEQDKDDPRLMTTTWKKDRQGKPELDSTTRMDTISEQEGRLDAEPQPEESSAKEKAAQEIVKTTDGPTEKQTDKSTTSLTKEPQTELPKAIETSRKIEAPQEQPKQQANKQPFAVFPDTKFTSHVTEVTTHFKPDEYWPTGKCPYRFQVFVDKPFTPPSKIMCNSHGSWCSYVIYIFSAASPTAMPLSDTNITTNQQQPQQPLRILPYNVSFGVGNTDFIREDQTQCFGSSAPEGKFCMNNFHDSKQQVKRLVKLKMNVTGYEYDNMVNWEERDPLPVFRGHPRTNVRGYWKNNPATKCPNHINSTYLGAFGYRPKAAFLAWEYPELLDVQVDVKPNPCFAINTTNGMDRAFRLGIYHPSHPNNQNLTKRPSRIKSSDFYTKYQVAVVLGGIGAAFRAVNHLAAGQCVVLQRFKFEEWYYKFLTPYVNYIPIKRDLSDLISTARWIKEHPQEVKEIARKGQEFYREYLNFPHNNDHWHELLWRLSERLHETNSTHEERWDYEKMVTFVRKPDGSFAEVADDVKIER